MFNSDHYNDDNIMIMLIYKHVISMYPYVLMLQPPSAL